MNIPPKATAADWSLSPHFATVSQRNNTPRVKTPEKSIIKMVKLEILSDDAATPYPEDRPFSEDIEFSESEDEFDDDFDANETLAERIAALKDIVPPHVRAGVSSSASSVSSFISGAASLSGKTLWTVASSALLLGVPLSLCIVGEQQLTEMEKGMAGGGDLLGPAPGPEGAAPGTL